MKLRGMCISEHSSSYKACENIRESASVIDRRRKWMEENIGGELTGVRREE